MSNITIESTGSRPISESQASVEIGSNHNRPSTPPGRTGGAGVEVVHHSKGASFNANTGQLEVRQGHQSQWIIGDDGLVDVGGFRTTPEAARKIGKHPDQLAQQATQQVPQSAPQPPAGDSGESTGTSEASADGQSEGAVSEPLMSPEGYEHSIEAVDAVAVLHENIPASVQVAAISRIADAGGDLNAGGLDGIAADLGLNAEALRSMSSTVFDNFAEQARHFCYKHNVDPDAFYEFARDREGAFSEAVTRQTSNQDLSGWANLIGQFKQSDDFRPAWSPERLMAHRWPAGYHVRQVPGTNEVLIAVPGRGEMELATALRLGIVNVPR